MASKCDFCTIRKTTIFADLKEDELSRIEKFIIEKTFPKKHIIFWEEDPVNNIYLIKRGNIKLYKTQSDGCSQILRIDGTGGVLGFNSLFCEKYFATAETITESVLCQIKADAFRKLLDKEPAINLGLLKAASRELEKNEYLLFTLGTRTAKERLALAAAVVISNVSATSARESPSQVARKSTSRCLSGRESIISIARSNCSAPIIFSIGEAVRPAGSSSIDFARSGACFARRA